MFTAADTVVSWGAGCLLSEQSSMVAILDIRKRVFSLDITPVAFSDLACHQQAKPIHFSSWGKATPRPLHIFHLSRLEPGALQTFSHIVKPQSKGLLQPTETDHRSWWKQPLCVKVNRSCGSRQDRSLCAGPSFSQPAASFPSFPSDRDLRPRSRYLLINSVFVYRTSISKSLVENSIPEPKWKQQMYVLG